MMPSEDLAGLQSETLQSIASLTKSAASLKEIPLWKNTPNHGKRLSDSIASVSGLFKKISQKITVPENPVNHLDGIHDFVDRFSLVNETIDDLLEKTDTVLDIVSGKRKALNTPVDTPTSRLVSVTVNKKYGNVNVFHTKNIIRPQLKFEDTIDNSNTPFVPKLKVKLNAKVPLHTSPVSEQMQNHLSSMGMINGQLSHSNHHPYQHEIETLEYPQRLFEIKQEDKFNSLEEVSLEWVESLEQLQKLEKLLTQAQEIAIDLEHHDYRSFQGFTCLMQISTRNADFLVDALALRSHLHILNSSFTDPKIIKVFHGADMDMQWLQKDFGLYVVNLFDTYHASKVLSLAQHGLGFLLKHYCDVETDKKYQLADWRIRPLPQEMSLYARMDTHYLLYIYDRMRNEILEKSDPSTHNLMHVCLQRSAQTSQKTYAKEIYDAANGLGPNGWFGLMSKTKEKMNEENFAVFKALHAYRDHFAREEDESIRYVLPNHMLLDLARVMPLDIPGVLGCCSPTPPLIKMNAADVAHLIKETLSEIRRNAAVKKKELEELRRSMEMKQKVVEPTHVRFDNLQVPEEAGDVPPMERDASLEMMNVDIPVVMEESASVFDAATTLTVRAVVKATAVSAFWENQLDVIGVQIEGAEKAEQIRASLSILAPSLEEMDMEEEITEPSSPGTSNKRPADENNVEQEKKQIRLDAQQATPFASEQPDAKSASSDHSDEEIQIKNVVQVARTDSQSKKKKKKKNKQGTSSSATEAIQTGDFKPFDYSQVTVETQPASQTKEFNPYSNHTSSHRGRNRGRGGRSKSGNKTFSFH